MTTFTYRYALSTDAAEITQQRYLMFSEMDKLGTHGVASLPIFETWVVSEIEAGRYVGLFALADEKIAAGAGLWWMPFPPGPLNIAPTRPYLLNVYTYAPYRRQGVARELVLRLMELARAEGADVVELHASSAGKPIYEALGYIPTNQMRIALH